MPSAATNPLARSFSAMRLSDADSFDPLDVFTRPPPGETPDERRAREQREQEAVERSRKIDAELKMAKIQMKQYKNAVKVILLGQSHSGKSTTVKNFQMTYAQKSWAEERLAWNSVILLNLVRSINIMTTTIETYSGTPNTKLRVTDRHKSTLLGLLPLRQIEKDLKIFLGAGASEEVETISNDLHRNFREPDKPTFKEFGLRSSSGWKSVFAQLQNSNSGKDIESHRVSWKVVRGCKDDIQWIWNDDTTKAILHERSVKLEDLPGFFLNDTDRILAEDYEPSDQDILCARLRTTGVQEYHFSMDRASTNSSPVNGTPLNWIMYDVAGSRTSRAAWIPYFKDVTALIFLAPLSGFNERLPEDNRVNRLEDSFALWRTVCSNKLLQGVQLILFMNKTDILRKKIEKDKVQIRKYIPDYDKPNDFESVANFFRRAFKKIYLQSETSDVSRTFMAHFTTAVDSKSTSQTLRAVQSTMLRTDILEAGLM